jgi:hypothetical protein
VGLGHGGSPVRVLSWEAAPIIIEGVVSSVVERQMKGARKQFRNNCRKEKLGSTFDCIGPFGGSQGKLFGAKNAAPNEQTFKTNRINRSLKPSYGATTQGFR